MKNQMVWLSIFFVAIIFFSGCHSNTMEGLGRDVQKVGEKIEN